MVRILLLVGLGGGVGSIFRYLISVYFSKNFPSSFPFGTFVINIVGCLLMGLFFGLSEKYQWLNNEWRIFLTVGFCGGFTTFSAFAFENLKWLQEGNYMHFFLYTIGSIAIGIIGVALGFYISKI